MHQNRIDLSNWLIHFVHDYNPDANPFEVLAPNEYNGPLYKVSHLNNPRFEQWQIQDHAYPVEDWDAFSVLQKIVFDGHLRSGWAFRSGRCTVYGPRSAVCFTEMPLYALLEYARRRNVGNRVTPYGVCLLRNEMFQAGARPAIYGVSGCHVETGKAAWPRSLADECGIAPHEQYRYVVTNLAGLSPVDWTHEREWRWCDVGDKCEVPGLPIWLNTAPQCFSRVLILVNTADEATLIVRRLQQNYDQGWHECDFEYHRDALENTHVIALQELLESVHERQISSLRLEDIPSHQLVAFQRAKASNEFIQQVRAAVEEAYTAADIAAKSWVESHVASNTLNDVCGFAYLVLNDNQSMEVQAFIDLKLVKVVEGVGYKIDLKIGRPYQSQCLGEREAAATAAANVLKRRLPSISIDVESYWD